MSSTTAHDPSLSQISAKCHFHVFTSESDTFFAICLFELIFVFVSTASGFSILMPHLIILPAEKVSWV